MLQLKREIQQLKKKDQDPSFLQTERYTLQYGIKNKKINDFNHYKKRKKQILELLLTFRGIIHQWLNLIDILLVSSSGSNNHVLDLANTTL